ncbi:hypothetical protein JXR93_12895 [bacterium]|nr:hypothetical protein [bacterium]
MIYQIDFSPVSLDFAIASESVSIYRFLSNKNQKDETKLEFQTNNPPKKKDKTDLLTNDNLKAEIEIEFLTNNIQSLEYQCLYTERFKLPIYCVKYSACGKYIAYGGKDGVVVLLDSQSLEMIDIFEFTGGFVESLDFSSDNRYLLISGQGGVIQIESILSSRDDKTDNTQYTFTKIVAKGFISAAIFVNKNIDGKYYIYTGGADNRLRLISFSEYGEFDTIEEIYFSQNSTWITNIRISDNLKTVFVGFGDGSILYKDLISNRNIMIKPNQFSQVTSIKVLDNYTILFSTEAGFIYKYRFHTLDILNITKDNQFHTLDIANSSNEKQNSESSNSNSSTNIIDVECENIIETIYKHSFSISSFTTLGESILFSSWDISNKLFVIMIS